MVKRVFFIFVIIILFVGLRVNYGLEVKNNKLMEMYSNSEEGEKEYIIQRRFFKCVLGCYDGKENILKGVVIRDLNDCSHYENCVECLDECINNSSLSEEKCFEILDKTINYW